MNVLEPSAAKEAILRTVTRRQFLAGSGLSAGSIALALALGDRLGLARALLGHEENRLRFGPLDPLVDLLQATPADELLALLVARLRAGASLADLVGAAALANARGFGGTHYNGYHALMAMMPSLEMAAQLPHPQAALPVLKVIHRNARFLAEAGRSNTDALEPIAAPSASAAVTTTGLADAMRRADLPLAEQSLAALAERSEAEAWCAVESVVRDEVDVHRVVLSWRAHDLLRLTGEAHAVTLLRQSVRHCVEADGQRLKQGRAASAITTLLPKLIDEHRLAERAPGTIAADEARIERLADLFYGPDRAAAAGAAAAALADGVDPEDVGRALSLAATRLVMHDPGRTKDEPGKPAGSVHGASVGVHASDSANAWRRIARASPPRDAFASLIAGAFHTAGQSGSLPNTAFDAGAKPCALRDPAALLREIDGRIRERDQAGACAAARRYSELDHPSDALFSRLLGFAVSEDGALHAEKYFRTAQEDHASARVAHRAAPLVALTRVMASSAGFPAPGIEDAKRLLAS